MTFASIASKVAKIEGGKSQARIGDVREILKILVDLEVEANKNGKDGPLTYLKDRADAKSKKK